MNIIDFERHNEEVNKIWEAYHNGNPVRIPMIIGMNPRMVILDEKYRGGVTFEKYYNNPQVMLETQLKFRKFEACDVVYDHIMGIPDQGWQLYPDFQNDVECGWLGAEVKYSDNAVPFTIPFLRDDSKKDMLFKKGIPALFSGLLVKALDYYNYFTEKKNEGFTYEGKPINSIWFPGMGTDGPMTVACMLRGTTEFCIDLYEDTEYALELLDYVTEAAIFRTKGLRKYFGQPEKAPAFWFADDSIQLLSCGDYEKFILPFHKKLINELSDGTQKNSIHLCGDASRHFKKIQDELNVYSFDTGFPINFKITLSQLSPETQMNGGVHVNTLLGASPEEIKKAVKNICGDVKPLSKKFVLREANNLSPKTPLENICAMYEAVKEFGRFE
ncbi:MAG: hypothetical protein FWD71_02075 [Oscillospiraceae bacterium]|nr:hypothetical protein [Oscillospiraceae bacterium]